MAAPTTTSLGLSLGTRPAGTPVTPALTGTIRILAVGDSLTFGTGNNELAWRQYVAEMLAAIGVTWVAVGNLASLAPNWAVHRAAFGWTIQQHIDAFTGTPSLLSTPDPDVIMICPLGNNDMGSDVDLAAAPGKMTALLEIFRAYTNGRGVKPRIVASYLYGKPASAADDARHDTFNGNLATLWATQIGLGQSITIVDPRPFINVPKISGMRSDNNHPSDIGYRRLADCYFPALCNAIGIDAQWGRPSS